MAIAARNPVDFSCLGLLAYLFQNLIKKYCNFTPEINEIVVNTFEINKDYFEIVLEGCNSIRLDTLLMEYKLYYKDKKYVREEYKTKFPVNLDFIINLIDKGLFYTETNHRIDELSYEIKLLKKQIKQISNIWQRFLSKK